MTDTASSANAGVQTDAAGTPLTEVTVTINGDTVTRTVEARQLLLHFIREDMELTGTHWGCDTSNCGACVVWVNGRPVKSCTTLTAMAGGGDVRTVEDLEGDDGLDPLQQGFMECHGLQCGFCTPGMLMTSRALLDANPNPSEDEIRDAISGNLCRCTGYEGIVKSIQWAAAASGSNGNSDRTVAADNGEGAQA